MPEVTYIGLAALQARAMAALAQGVTLAAEDLEGRAKGATPVKTGTLEGSIHTDGPNTAGFAVTAKVSTGGESSGYAIMVHEGTGPHVIRPAGKKALSWPGAAHPVKSVSHPGTPAFKYLERPLLQMAPVYREFIARAARAAF